MKASAVGPPKSICSSPGPAPTFCPWGTPPLVNAVREIYALPAEANHKHFGAIAENWRPWRGVAVWYLYRSINMQRAAAKEAVKTTKLAAKAAKLGMAAE